MPIHDQTLLQTKLHQPRLPKDLITRTRLVEQLNHDIDLPLILVCAPAGFGKTTLVSNWLAHMAADPNTASARLPAAWLSLDENDSDLTIFLRYFIAAIRTIFEGACESILALIQAQRQPPNEIIYATFSNELDKLPGECILVLDDYQTIQGDDVPNLLAEMMHHWPRPLHLVLVSRLNPRLPLSRLLANGMLGEIRTKDLRFSADEVAAYLNQVQVTHLSPNVLSLLQERIEGWPAGLHLATLSLRSAGSQEDVLARLVSAHTNITAYLVKEVLSHQFPAIHLFLLKTSILDRFCASLCTAVIRETDPAWNAGACLEWIERSELFLIPLDDRREWYRYHHLFQELLQKMLVTEIVPGEINNLHLRASAWFEEQGLIDEAIDHALAADNLDMVAHLVSGGLCDALNRQDRPILERWLRLLPDEKIQRNPSLLMVRIWILEWTWQLDQQIRVLKQVEGLLDSDAGVSMPMNDLKILRGQILEIKAQHAYFSNQTRLAIDLCQQSLALLPSSWTFARGGAMFFLGMSMQANGESLAAERLLLSEYRSCDENSNTYAMLILRSLSFVYLITGQLEQASRIAHVQLERSIHSNIAIMKNWADWFLGVICYQRNELEVAAQHFTQIVENRFTAHLSTYRDAVAGLALIHQIHGESAKARQMLDGISQFDLEQIGSEDERTRALRARLMLLQGDLETAGRWADAFTDLPPDQPLLWLEVPQLTRAHVLVARGADADQRLALQILDVLLEITGRTQNNRYKIEVLALRALALNALGDTDGANAALKQALDLALPGGFIRVFVDLGKPMQKILQQLDLEKPGYSFELVSRILAVFQEDKKYRTRRASPRQPTPGASFLFEPLTPRELEVLSMLCGPLSIKEIALKLNISYATARRHAINIYGKLGVNGRLDAVARTKELQILPPR